MFCFLFKHYLFGYVVLLLVYSRGHCNCLHHYFIFPFFTLVFFSSVPQIRSNTHWCSRLHTRKIHNPTFWRRTEWCIFIVKLFISTSELFHFSFSLMFPRLLYVWKTETNFRFFFSWRTLLSWRCAWKSPSWSSSCAWIWLNSEFMR